MTVDSFVDPSTNEPVALGYLQSIGVDPSAIECVVATHWDQDHIAGIPRVVRAADSATVVLSAALKSRDFVTLAIRHQARTYASPLGSGTKDFVRLLDLVERDKRDLRIVMQDTVLLERDGVRLVALSPSSSTAIDALTASSVAVLEAASTGDSVVEPTPNAASVVLAIRFAHGDVLLGADLETAGWQMALQATTAHGLQARMFKVPHHGSGDADDPAIWTNHMSADAVYAVTRFNNGDRSLPSDQDRARLRGRSHAGHVLGASATRRHLHGVVGRRVRAATRNGVWRVTGPVGHYQCRLKLGGSDPWVATSGAVEAI
jgi:hypothetical protein